MSDNREPGRAPGDPPSASCDPGETRRPKAGAGRDARLAAALRANLARRKAQGRARAADAADNDQRAADAADSNRGPAADAADGRQEE